MKSIKVIKKSVAIKIAANHNCVPLEVAQNYTESELKEILNRLGIKAKIQ